MYTQDIIKLILKMPSASAKFGLGLGYMKDLSIYKVN
jgi:hypothetical protein